MRFIRWKHKWSKEGSYDSVNMQTLSDIARGMQYCVNSTSEMLERQQMERLNKFFHEDGRPFTQKFIINDNACLDVPLITLMTDNTLVLDEMNVKMTLSVKDLVPKDSRLFVGDGARERENFYSRTAFNVTLAGAAPEQQNGTDINIEMKFKTGDSPEAVARLVEKYANSIAITPIE